MKLVIGLVGKKGAGKETFSNILEELLSKKKISRVGTGDFLRETLTLWSIPNTRSNLQNLSIIMRKQYGNDVVPNAVKGRITESKADIVILDGLRWEADYELLRSFPKNILVYITADLALRFKRLRKRGEKADESKVGFAQFKQEEKAATETLIPELGKRAEIKLNNNGSMSQFRKQVQKILPKLT